jgi:hypothetical protein
MIHPHTELRFINETIGYGVVATRLIPRGTITWVRDAFDQVFSAARIDRLEPIYRDIIAKYCFVDAKGDFILCWDLARYVNHACDPTCRSAGYDFELAVRDIQPGEELTDDYGALNLEYDFTCCCGSANCRGKIRPSDLLRYADRWDEAVAEPFRLLSKVPQPLWPLVQEKDAITAVLANGLAPASCRQNYYGDPTSSLTQGVR